MLSVLYFNRRSGKLTVVNPCTASIVLITSLRWELVCAGRRFTGETPETSFLPGEAVNLLLDAGLPAQLDDGPALLTVSEDEIDRGYRLSLPPVDLTAPPVTDDRYLTGVRRSGGECRFSTGKLAGVLTASGLRELTWNGETVLSGLRVPTVSRDGVPLKTLPDRLTADAVSAECHGLVLARAPGCDDLEYTWRLTPLRNGSIRAAVSVILPDKFPQLTGLRLEMRFPGGTTEPDLTTFEVIRKYGLAGVDQYQPPSCRKVHTAAGVELLVMTPGGMRAETAVEGNELVLSLFPSGRLWPLEDAGGIYEQVIYFAVPAPGVPEQNYAGIPAETDAR